MAGHDGEARGLEIGLLGPFAASHDGVALDLGSGGADAHDAEFERY